MNILRYIFLYLTAICLMSWPQVGVAADAWPGDSGTVIGDSSTLGSDAEPSGATTYGSYLILVYDNGYVVEMQKDGTLVNVWDVGEDLDLEGVTVVGDVAYLGDESDNSIKEFDLSSGTLTGNSWPLSGWMINGSNRGLEGLTFVPNGAHPYSRSTSGGVFYVGQQETGYIFVFDVDLSSSGTVSYLDTLVPASYTDISGLEYDSNTNLVYAIFDGDNIIVAMRTDGGVLKEVALPGDNQEGIAVEPDCGDGTASVYITEDSGADPEVIQYGEYPMICAPTGLKVINRRNGYWRLSWDGSADFYRVTLYGSHHNAIRSYRALGTTKRIKQSNLRGRYGFVAVKGWTDKGASAYSPFTTLKKSSKSSY